jgi:hypothetical protein
MTDIYKWSTANWVSSFNSSWFEFDEYFKEFRIPPLQKVIQARDIFAHCLNSAHTLVTPLALHYTSNTRTYKLHLKPVNKLQAHFADTNKNHTTMRKPHPSITAHTFLQIPTRIMQQLDNPLINNCRHNLEIQWYLWFIYIQSTLTLTKNSVFRD